MVTQNQSGVAQYSTKAMKVVYDISVLGLGHYLPTARTGVFRVIENLAYGLNNSKECSLSFCVSESSERLYAALDYLEYNTELANVPLPHKNWKFKQSICKTQRQINSQIDTVSYSQKLILKALRKVLGYVYRGTEILHNPIDFQTLTDAHIYHSPFDPIPEPIIEKTHIEKFLTIYDLIPILYPHFFKSNEQNNVVKAISNLPPDSWFTCISQSTKDDLCNYSKSIDPSRVFVTHLAASKLFYPCFDSQQLELTRSKYNIPDAPYILSLSTLEPRKNIDHTIRCFIDLVQQENIKDLYLVLVGTKGWDYDKILAEVSSNSTLKNRIIIRGYVADEDLAALYSGAIAFVYPSFYEGFGLPPLEAMQCGVPVITSNTSSLPEVVGDAGIMLDPKDADGLSQSMFELYNKPSLRESMSCNSLEQAKKFSWEKCTQQTIQAYKTALGG